ncbi:DUF1772 domain-containing protein [Modestobacter altitudinis]|uniref:DUF1772 domain-containing protein n=1 Tax=Modestobacter altitudinis TaxID=2213158 RepID=UPI00110D1C06|nr:DUF1772 domain-containing protein [Modestobacter altitudinis]
MSAVAVAHLLLVGGYAGFQWTVRALVYPQFAAVPHGSFAEYESSHSRRIARVVGPLFAGQLGTTGWLLAGRPAGVVVPALVASAVCLAVVLAVTGLVAVPQHRVLGAGFDRAAYARLLRADDVRVAAATVNVVVSAWAVLG